MKENSIKEDIEILEKNIKSVKENADMAFFESDEDYCFFKAVEHILSAYKKILKENEILKEEKEQAWEEWNSLEQGSYETEQKLKQQIKESQKENEELKLKNKTLEELATTYQGNCISVQKVKDKMEKDIKTNEHTILGGRRNGKTLEYGKRLGRIEMCQELLERRK